MAITCVAASESISESSMIMRFSKRLSIGEITVADADACFKIMGDFTIYATSPSSASSRAVSSEFDAPAPSVAFSSP